MKPLQRILCLVLLSVGIAFGGSDQAASSTTNQPSENQPVPKTVMVHITKTGKKYHLAGCRYLKRSDVAVDLKTAKELGLTPCSVCRPPE